MFILLLGSPTQIYTFKTVKLPHDTSQAPARRQANEVREGGEIIKRIRLNSQSLFFQMTN
jgi:hypothetical protein